MKEVQPPYSQEAQEPAAPAPGTDGFVNRTVNPTLIMEHLADVGILTRQGEDPRGKGLSGCGEGTRAAVDAVTKNPFQRFRDLLTKENLLGALRPRRFGEPRIHVRIWHYPERPNILAISFTDEPDNLFADTGLSFDFGQTQPDGTLPYKTGNNTVLFDELEIIIDFLHKKADECGVKLVNVGSGFF